MVRLKRDDGTLAKNQEELEITLNSFFYDHMEKADYDMNETYTNFMCHIPMVITNKHNFMLMKSIEMEDVTVDFTTRGGSHLYGLPCPSADSLDPMDHFCTFDVSKIIPKNMDYWLYMTFKPILIVTHSLS